MTYSEVANSSYLQTMYYQGAGTLPQGTFSLSNNSIIVGLMLDRANDPSQLLNSNWASRQEQIATLKNSGSLWTTYGADPAKYGSVVAELQSMGATILDISNSGYVSSPESRTVWVELTPETFSKLFNTQLYSLTNDGNPRLPDIQFWKGNLSLPQGWQTGLGVKGIYIEVGSDIPFVTNNGTAVQLTQGPQSPGNDTTDPGLFYPSQIADQYYNFPLSSSLEKSNAQTGAIGLIEQGIGAALPPGSASFQSLLDQYRANAGINTPGAYAQVGPAGAAQYSTEGGGERSLDVSVVTASSPNSTILLYTGPVSGTALATYQAAIWDTKNNPAVISSSFGASSPAANSPFLYFGREVLKDAALRNISFMDASGDQGSNEGTANGLANITTIEASPYIISVGGTSLSEAESAYNDRTIAPFIQSVSQGDYQTLFQLVAGGMKTAPRDIISSSWYIETVWNQYVLSGVIFEDLANNLTGSGGVDSTQVPPNYQKSYGYTPLTSSQTPAAGRGLPDVSALAGGNMEYAVTQADMTGLSLSGGTSASAPLWASLISQYNAIFADQGLPSLGYMNDLLYNAAAVAPASFNDVSVGNNTSSFYYSSNMGASIYNQNINTGAVSGVTATGYGYQAGQGYDLTTGLGSPNGVLLGRALTTIANAQSYSSAPAVIDPAMNSSAKSNVNQTLLVQNELSGGASATVNTTHGSVNLPSNGQELAWSAQLAQQVLQSDFDPQLIHILDQFSQNTPSTITVAAGDTISSVTGSGASLQLYQNDFTNSYGFVNFGSGSAGDVVLARPVAVAATAGGEDNQAAIIRLRHAGATIDQAQTKGYDLSLEVFNVDDFTGGIHRPDGTTSRPGDSDYAALAASRDYATISGSKVISAPSYGGLATPIIQHVGEDDIIAMKLTNNTTNKTYWSFATQNAVSGTAANETHLWSYGLNTWGWDASSSGDGGSNSFTDLIVGFDFTSLAGHQYLADTGTTYTVDTNVSGNSATSTYLLYQSAFNRFADRTGLDFWAQTANSQGLTPVQVANAFISSPEFTQVYGVNISNKEYVTELYEYTFGRTPDAAGLTYWTQLLDQGIPKAEVMAVVALSSESFADYATRINNGYWVV